MLIINGKQFHGELTNSKRNEIFNEIMKLPKPELHSPFQSSHIKSEETVLCLQGEVAHVCLDDSNPFNNPIKYLGSKEVYSCVQVFVHTDTDYLTVHFDTRRTDINPFSQLQYFKDKQNIQMSFIGGRNNDTSRQNIDYIITMIFKASEEYGLNIIINEQQLLENTEATTHSKLEVMYNEVIYKANLASIYLFQEEINTEEFSKFHPQDFLQKNIDKNMDIMAQIIVAAGEVYDRNKSESAINLLQEVKTFYGDKAEFIRNIQELFSINGFQYLNKYYNDYLDGMNSLVNFVYEIPTGKIHVISPELDTPHEDLRRLFLYDKESHNLTFSLCYDGRINKWIVPNISANYMKGCQKVTESIHKSIGSFDKIHGLLGIRDTGNSFRKVIQPINKMVSNNFKFNPRTENSFFKSKADWKKVHDRNIQPVETEFHTQLERIQIVTGLPFKAKIRNPSSPVEDAVFKCNSRLQAGKIEESLQQHKINSHIVEIQDQKNTTSFYALVPNINELPYSENIYAAKVSVPKVTFQRNLNSDPREESDHLGNSGLNQINLALLHNAIEEDDELLQILMSDQKIDLLLCNAISENNTELFNLLMRYPDIDKLLVSYTKKQTLFSKFLLEKASDPELFDTFIIKIYQKIHACLGDGANEYHLIMCMQDDNFDFWDSIEKFINTLPYEEVGENFREYLTCPGYDV